MEIHLKICGVLLVVLSCAHIVFPSYFKWKEEMEKVSLINRQMMYVHTFFIALVVLLMGIFCVCCSAELCSTSLGRKIAFGFFLFWLCRLVIQFAGYSSKLWMGKPLETAIHIVFSFIWVYLTSVFFMVWRG